MKKLALCLALLAILCCNHEVKPEDSFYIKDAQGRIVIYHGLNICNSSKGAPYLPWQQEKDFRQMKQEWGFNFARYLVFWEAIEPARNQYDTSYMKATLTLLKRLKDDSIDVVIDFHQDLYADKFTGDGFPTWTVNDGGFEFTQRTPWNLNYLEPAVLTAFNEFWASDSLKRKYIDAVRYALTWFDSLIVGVDVMNEPFPGVNLKFEQKTLTDFYTGILKMMKENGFKSRMYFEPWMCTSAGLPTMLKFKPDSTCVYFPHYYDPITHEGRPYNGFNRNLMQEAIPCKVGEAQKFGVPIVFGEFAVTGDIVKNNMLQYLDDFLALSDRFCFGWAYYSFERGQVVDGAGNTDTVVMPKLVQVYPQRVAGINPRMWRGPDSFCLTYTACGIKSPSTIFIPPSLQDVSITVDDSSFSFDDPIFEYVADTGKQEISIKWK